MEERMLDELKYLISYPKDFREDRKYPLVLFLHGAGYRSESTDRLKKNSSFNNILQRQDERGYIFIAPLCHRGTWHEWMPVLIRLVESYRKLPYVDETRIHLTGLSMGGYGTWTLASLRPHWFASAMPVCGGGIGGFAMNLVDIPIRAFHGLRDAIVDPIESLQMVKAVNMQGGYAELILFPECGHNCFRAVYGDEKNYDWLLSFTADPDKFSDIDPSTAVFNNKAGF